MKDLYTKAELDKYSKAEIDQIAKNNIEAKGYPQVWESYLEWKSKGNEDKCYADYCEHMVNEVVDLFFNFSIKKFRKLYLQVWVNERRN